MAVAKALLLTAALAVTTAALFRHGEAFGVKTILAVPTITLKNFSSKQRRLGMQSTHDERHGGSGIDIGIGGFDGLGKAARHSRATGAGGGLLPRPSQIENKRPKRLAAALLGATTTAACLVFARRCIHTGLAKRTLANAAALAVYGWFCWKTLVSKLQEDEQQHITAEILSEPTAMVTTGRSGSEIDAPQPTPTAATKTTTTTTNSYIEIEVSETILKTTSPDLLMSF